MMMTKKLIALALTASLALPLAACDWGTPKADNSATLNENGPANESEMGNATLGNDTMAADETDNATLVDQAGPETNTVEGNTM